MKQLFEVGEVVIRQAPNYSEHNGEYTVIGIISSSQMKEQHPRMTVTDGLYYELDGLAISLLSGDTSRHSFQDYLKKKHDKGELSFKSLMNSLKSPVLEWK